MNPTTEVNTDQPYQANSFNKDFYKESPYNKKIANDTKGSSEKVCIVIALLTVMILPNVSNICWYSSIFVLYRISLQRKNQFRFSLNAEESQWSTKFNSNSFQPLSASDKTKVANDLPEVEIVTASPMSDSEKVTYIDQLTPFEKEF